MSNVQHSGSRVGRFVRALVVPTILLFGATACLSNSDTPEGSANVAPDAKQALTALNAALESHAAGDLTAATAGYNKTLKYDATNKFAFYNLALIDEAGGNYGLAEAKYRSALETDAAYEPALFNLAVLRTARSDPKEAVALYERAVAAGKNDAAAWLNLGLLLRANGQERAGDKDVLRALALNPKLKDPAAAEGPGDKPTSSE